MRKFNNKGLSYIEMLVVVSIAAVMVGIFTISIGVVTRNNVTKAANKLEGGLSKAQVLCMSKNTTKGCINIYYESGKYYYYYGTDIDNRVCFCQEPCTVELRSIDNAVTTYVGSTPSTIAFKNTTGALDMTQPIVYNQIFIYNNGDDIAYLYIDKLTGKVIYQLV